MVIIWRHMNLHFKSLASLEMSMTTILMLRMQRLLKVKVIFLIGITSCKGVNLLKHNGL